MALVKLFIFLNYSQCLVSSLLILVTFIISINSQINFDENNYQNRVKIRMCCDLNFKMEGGSSCNDDILNVDINGIPNRIMYKPKRKSHGKFSKDNVGGIKFKRHLTTTEWTVPAHFMSNNERTTFWLENSQPPCTNGNELRMLEIENETNPEFHVLPNGWIGIGPNVLNMSYFNPDQYCVNGFTDTSIELRTCKPPCSPQEPCIYKCCPMNQVFSPFHPNRGCEDIPNGITYRPNYYKNPNSLLSEDEALKKSPFYIIRHPSAFAKMCVDETTLLYVNTKEVSDLLPSSSFINFRISETGNIYMRNKYRNWIPAADENICVDGLQNYILEESDEEVTIVPTPFRNDFNQSILFTCKSPV